MVRLPVAALLALAIVACGGVDEKKDAPAAATSPWLALLDVVPDTADVRQIVVMNDYEAMRKLANLEAPKDAAAVAEYRRQMLIPPNGAMPSHISGLGQQFDPHLWSAQLGFHPGQVDQDLQTGKPPNNVDVVRGRFDAAAIDSAIDKDTSGVRKLLTRTAREGVTIYVWGEDHKQDLQNRSALRPLGRGDRLAVKGDTLFWAHATPPIDEMIDAATGKKPSLADAADVKELMAGVVKHDLYAVTISNIVMTPDALDVIGANPSVVREAREASFKEALKPYTLFAICYGQDAQGPFSLVVLLHTSDALARENVGKLQSKIDTGTSVQSQKPWKELIPTSEITAEGKVVSAKLRPTNRLLLTQVMNNRDSLLVRE